MSNTVKIILDNYNDVCYPGQTLAGRVECVFSEEKSVRAIRIKFKGRAKTEWRVSSGSGKNKRTVTYHAREEYFDAEYNLFEGGEDFELSAGKHTYPFSYILPLQLPSSFEGSYGNIRYKIEATVDRPWKFDYDDTVILKLVSPLDLNYLPGLRESVSQSVDKSVCCCWCKSGPITFDISVPITGYALGEDVNIGAYVENMSNISIEAVKFKIVQEIEFIAHHPSTRKRFDEDEVTSLFTGGIGAHGEKSWTSILKIPRLRDFPNLQPCNIINVTYQLKAKVVLPCPHKNLNTEFPIMIGTIPLTGVNTTLPGPPVNELPLPMYSALLVPQINSYPPPPGATAPLIEQAPDLINPSAPYPSAETSTSYGRNSNLSVPLVQPESTDIVDSDFELPSYEEVQHLKDKNGKH